jgi:hypothetical protein
LNNPGWTFKEETKNEGRILVQRLRLCSTQKPLSSIFSSLSNAFAKTATLDCTNPLAQLTSALGKTKGLLQICKNGTTGKLVGIVLRAAPGGFEGK